VSTFRNRILFFTCYCYRYTYAVSRHAVLFAVLAGSCQTHLRLSAVEDEGTPAHASLVLRPGPRIRADCEGAHFSKIDIPEGYQYVYYDEKPGTVFKRASYEVHYVGANSEAELERKAGLLNQRSVGANVSAELAGVIELGAVGGEVHHDRVAGQHDLHRHRFTHEALILIGQTKRI